MLLIKIIGTLLIFLMTLIAGSYLFLKKSTTQEHTSFPISESLAAGVFLGMALMHMFNDASESFYRLHFHYPLAALLMAVTFLFLLWLEHLGRELTETKTQNENIFSILATVMLSIHAFLMGVALGLSSVLSVAIILLLAILAHKWAESFSLAIQIAKSHFNHRTRLLLFFIFAMMTPLGILLGGFSVHMLEKMPLLQPIFSSLAAGTFLYLGTLHGLENATLIKRCCELKRFYFVILGFMMMAVVAIWN